MARPRKRTVRLNAGCRDFLAFCLEYLVWPEGPPAGQPLDWLAEPWFVVDVINPLFEVDPNTARRRYETVFVGLAKGNIKSTFGGALVPYFLARVSTRPGNRGMQIYSIAASRDQAAIVFNLAKQMVEDSPLLKDIIEVYASSLYMPDTRATFKVLSSDAPKTHGKRPSVVICDELHAHENGDLYSSLETAMVTAAEPLMVVLTNAGANEQGDSIWAQVYRKGREGSDPSMYFYSPAVPVEHAGDPDWWKLANPASFITKERLVALSKKMPPFRFQRWHLNIPTRAIKSWLLPGTWDACVGDSSFEEGETLIVGVDMSRRHDSAAVVAVSATSPMRAQCWTWATWPDPNEPPPEVTHVLESDVIPFNAPLDQVRALAGRYNVVEVPYDPWRIPDATAEELELEGLPMVRFDQGPSRMAPAAQGLFDAVTYRRIVHDGDPKFAAQIAAAAVKDLGRRGWVFDKNEDRQFMDATIALTIAVDRAAEWVGSTGEFVVMH